MSGTRSTKLLLQGGRDCFELLERGCEVLAVEAKAVEAVEAFLFSRYLVFKKNLITSRPQ